MKTLSTAFAAFGQGLSFDSLPTAVVDKAQLMVLDTLGCALAARGTPSAAAVARAVLPRAGRGGASTIGQAERIAPADAALHNGTLAHVLDYDDTHSGSVVHASSALVPAVLAVAEERGRSGREALTALVAGVEVALRIGLPARHGFHLQGFHSTAVDAPFGAALATGMLRGQSARTMVDALGIVGSFGAGLMEAIPAGASAKQLHSGIAASAGIRAAELAEAGFEGPATVFEGRLGLYNALIGPHQLDLARPVDALGQRWELMDLCPKLYPCCGHLLSFLDAARQLRSEGVCAADIARIELKTSQACANVVCEPWDRKLAPSSAYEAKFSLPFGVALMLVRGHAGLADFTEEACRDTAILALLPRIGYAVDPGYAAADFPAWIEVTLADGSRKACHVPVARGDSRDPIPAPELLEKFRANTAHLGGERSERLISEVSNLARAPSLDALSALLRSA